MESSTTTGSPAGQRPRRVGLFGLFGVGNLGNEASLAAALATIRASATTEVDIVVCAVPDDVAERHGVPTTSIAQRTVHGDRGRSARVLGRLVAEPARWWRAWRIVRRTDAIVVPGTGILDDYGVSPWQMPYDLLVWTAAARLARRPFHFVAIGAGPIEHPASRRLMRAAARLATTVSYRDEQSRAFMERIGRNVARDAVVPDIVFALDVPPAEPARPAPGATVGVGVMAYDGWNGRGEHHEYERYLGLVTDIVHGLVARGHPVRLLIGEYSDRRVVDDVRERCEGRPGQSSLEAPRIDDMGDVLSAIARCDVVVVTRYHNLVGALMVRRPVVSVSYASKNDALLNAFGVRDADRPIAEARASWVLEQVDDICDGSSARPVATLEQLDRWALAAAAALIDPLAPSEGN